MIRRIAMTAALALAGCSTYDSVNHAAYRDGNYGGNYDGGYYSASADGYGDYYYDRPQVVYDTYDGGYFGGSYAGFGFGSAWAYGFGYDPWFSPWYGYRYPHWHRPWHHHAVVVGIDRHDIQRPTQASPFQRPDRGSRTDGQRDGGRFHEDRMHPRHPPR